MLSEKGFQIILSLANNNGSPTTSKKLAKELGMSERSIKSYMKEVSDFCEENGIQLTRKPGMGIVAQLDEEQIWEITKLRNKKKIVMSKSQRMSYIVYTLLSGWKTYTLTLFSEELFVSKKVIREDVDTLAESFNRYNIKMNRVTGQGVFITGNEYNIRRAMKALCRYPIGNKKVDKSADVRIDEYDEEILINNFGQDNFDLVVEAIKTIEEKYNIVFTDYSYTMMVQYLCVALFRIRMGKLLDKPIDNGLELINDDVVDTVAEIFSRAKHVVINQYEREYIAIMFAASAIQDTEQRYEIIKNKEILERGDELSEEMLLFISEIINIDDSTVELLKPLFHFFVPASMLRTKYSLEIINPYLSEVQKMYAGIYASCFMLGKFYEKVADSIPTDHELSFIAMFLSGALHRDRDRVRAVLIGSGGMASIGIIARKIENKISELKIVGIVSREKLDMLEDYDYDLIISTTKEIGLEHVYISPMISKSDEDNVREKCKQIIINLKGHGIEKLIEEENILFIDKAKNKQEVLTKACNELIKRNSVTKGFLDDVIKRENIEPTIVGDKVAIPHGRSENVKESRLCIIKLDEPVDWGESNVDLIFLLAINFDDHDMIKEFFKDFTPIIENNDVLNMIRDCTDARSILEILSDAFKEGR